MRVEKLYLKDYFPELGKNGCNAYVECYILDQMKACPLQYDAHPCLLICPGGAYVFTSDREAEPVALNFMAEGYSVFVLRYSVAPHTFPQRLLEVAATMELIHQNAKEWECNADDVTIMGFSAGGHLAAQYSNRYDCEEVRTIFPESKPVQKAVLAYPVITWEKPYAHEETLENFVGHPPVSGEEKGCSCELLVTEKTPPTFLWHTTEDATVPVENSLIYARKLAQYKVPFELHIYPYGGHGLSTSDEHTCTNVDESTRYNHRWVEECKRWLKLESHSK